MKKLLIIVGVVIVVLVGAVFLVGSSFLGGIVKAGVQQYGPTLTGTPVTLDSASVSPLSGSGSLTGLTVANPEGYTTPRAIYFGKVALGVDPMSLTSAAVHIKSIEVDQPEFTYERKLTSGNLDQILKNIQAATASGKAEPQKQGKQVKMIIDSVVIQGGRVNLSAFGQETGVDVPRIELHDIGKAEGGVTPAQASLQIMQVVLKQVIDVGVKAIEQGKVKIGDQKTQEKIQQAGQVLQGLLGGQKKQ